MASAWRSLVYGGGGGGSAAAADIVAGRQILEKLQLALTQAFQKHGAHALSVDEIAPIKALCNQLLPAHCTSISLSKKEIWNLGAGTSSLIPMCVVVLNGVNAVQLSVPDAHASQQPQTAAARRKARHVRYQHIWEDDKFSMGCVAVVCELELFTIQTMC